MLLYCPKSDQSLYSASPLAGQPPSRSGKTSSMASPHPITQRAAARQRWLGVARQTPLQTVHGSVQQLHSDAPGPGEHAGGNRAAERSSRRRRSRLLPAPLPVWDVHTDVSRGAFCEGDALRGRRVQESDGGHERSLTRRHTHTESRIQVWL